MGQAPQCISAQLARSLNDFQIVRRRCSLVAALLGQPADEIVIVIQRVNVRVRFAQAAKCRECRRRIISIKSCANLLLFRRQVLATGESEAAEAKQDGCAKTNNVNLHLPWIMADVMPSAQAVALLLAKTMRPAF